jgi:hypothetical protein
MQPKDLEHIDLRISHSKNKEAEVVTVKWLDQIFNLSPSGIRTQLFTFSVKEPLASSYKINLPYSMDLNALKIIPELKSSNLFKTATAIVTCQDDRLHVELGVDWVEGNLVAVYVGTYLELQEDHKFNCCWYLRFDPKIGPVLQDSSEFPLLAS